MNNRSDAEFADRALARLPAVTPAPGFEAALLAGYDGWQSRRPAGPWAAFRALCTAFAGNRCRLAGCAALGTRQRLCRGAAAGRWAGRHAAGHRWSADGVLVGTDTRIHLDFARPGRGSVMAAEPSVASSFAWAHHPSGGVAMLEPVADRADRRRPQPRRAGRLYCPAGRSIGARSDCARSFPGWAGQSAGHHCRTSRCDPRSASRRAPGASQRLSRLRGTDLYPGRFRRGAGTGACRRQQA